MMQDEAVRRWVARHPVDARLRAGFELCDVAMEQVIAQVRRENPDATPEDVRAHIRRLKEAR